MVAADFVLTPLADYLVVGFDDPEIVRNPKRKGGFFDFSGDYTFPLRQFTPDIVEEVIAYFSLNPDIMIRGQKKTHHQRGLAAARVGDILSKEHITAEALQYQAEIRESQEKYASQGYAYNIPAYDELYGSVVNGLAMSSWFQLIERSAENRFVFPGEVPPRRLIMDDEGKGIAIIDAGIGGNCGYGVGNITVYSIVEQSAQVRCQDSPFLRICVELERCLETTIQYIPRSHMDRESLAKLSQAGTVFKLDDSLVYVNAKPGLPRLGNI